MARIAYTENPRGAPLSEISRMFADPSVHENVIVEYMQAVRWQKGAEDIFMPRKSWKAELEFERNRLSVISQQEVLIPQELTGDEKEAIEERFNAGKKSHEIPVNFEESIRSWRHGVSCYIRRRRTVV